MLIITKPSTTKWAYTDSSTLSTISLGTQRGGGGGILLGKVTNLVFWVAVVVVGVRWWAGGSNI